MLTRNHGVAFRDYYPTIVGRHSSSCYLTIPQEIDRVVQFTLCASNLSRMDFFKGLPQTLNMIHHKTTQNAIAAMSRLAELHADDSRSASSRELAESRNLPVPLVAKILTVLSRNGLVTGSPGPGGGYRLAKPPAKIRLKDVAVLFERETEGPCAYGPGWCGHGTPCPIHDSISEMKEVFEKFLTETTFTVFEDSGMQPTKSRAKGKKKT